MKLTKNTEQKAGNTLSELYKNDGEIIEKDGYCFVRWFVDDMQYIIIGENSDGDTMLEIYNALK